MELFISQPDLKYQKSYNSYIEELGDEERYPMPMDLDHSDFSALITKLKSFALGENLTMGLVPNSTLWLVQEDELCGVSNIRHELNQKLVNAGGHIGIGIRPLYRNRGLGKYLLGKTIEKAKMLGIYKVHIHCYAENIGSTKMIAACGGKLHSNVTLKGKLVSRYIVT